MGLSDYLNGNKEDLSIKISENERSFAIWGKEKFLSGKTYDGISAVDILKHCGIKKDYLNTYRTAEPLAYYSCNEETPKLEFDVTTKNKTELDRMKGELLRD